MELHQVKNLLLHSKTMINKVERNFSHEIGENICKYYTMKAFNIQNIKYLYNSQPKKKKKHLKMGRGSKYTFFKRRHRWLKAHKKMPEWPPVIRKMPNQTRIRYHITPLLVAIIKKTGSNKCCGRCGEKKTLVNCW